METIQNFLVQHAQHGYLLLMGIVLLENAGIPVPGETAVLVAGFLASPSEANPLPEENRFHLGWVIVLTMAAAVIGDNLGFWLGRRFARPRLQQQRRFLFLTPKSLRVAEGYFETYGSWTIFFGRRFITGIRVFGALAAGTAGMPWQRFLIANACGALAWAVTMSLLGYFFGQSLPLLHRWLGTGGLIVLGCVIAAVAGALLWRRWRKR